MAAIANLPRPAMTDTTTLLATPFEHLLQSRDLALLWLMRIAVHMCDPEKLWCSSSDVRRPLMRRLELQHAPMADEAQRAHFVECLASTLEAMEHQASAYRHDPVLAANLDMLTQQLSMSELEAQLLALAVLFRTDDLLDQVADETHQSGNLPRQLRTVLRAPIEDLSRIVKSNALLRRSGLLELQSGGPLGCNVRVSCGSLRRLAVSPLTSLNDLLGDGLVRRAPPSELQDEDYAHIQNTLDILRPLLADALEHLRTGVNILLYGPPGTGKTQLIRWLAGVLVAPLYEVSPSNDSHRGDRPAERLAKTATCQLLLKGHPSLLVMDECDAIFDDEAPTLTDDTACRVKAWVNDLLETNPVPMVWIANRIQRMDPAFVRRFDMVVHLDVPPLAQRLKLLERTGKSLLDRTQCRRIAMADRATPGVLARAISVAERVQARGTLQDPATVIESILDGTLRAQGHSTVRMANRSAPPDNYDTAFCSTNTDLDALTEGLRRAGQGRILLYGPPGTGKTAFGYWMASSLGRPLVLKRMSDLQSPYLGEMEHNLAKAFEDAARDEAVLQIDEVDSFLQDRRHAARNWERSQVNEFLTQLESFEGIFIASTNLMDGLDQAALRRFDHKVRIGYLRPEQAWTLLLQKLAEWRVPMTEADICRRRLDALTQLTPGDFAVIARRQALIPFRDALAVAEALAEELRLKDPPSRRIGFI
jgi:SpoVK/Ycf46/Vps4 family AAA+-type ATPase